MIPLNGLTGVAQVGRRVVTPVLSSDYKCHEPPRGVCSSGQVTSGPPKVRTHIVYTGIPAKGVEFMGARDLSRRLPPNTNSQPSLATRSTGLLFLENQMEKKMENDMETGGI